jgi:type III restriction enzyme
MKLQFDANQTFQLNAIAAVADIFDGQPQGAPEFSVIKMVQDTELFAGQERSELGLGNRLLVDDAKLLRGARLIQARNDIEVADDAATLEGWEIFDPAANAARTCPHFSVEMETGTGKTYVYLRTVFELSRRYGFKKFIIVVPSVAIREGVLKNIEITAEHFRALYDNMPFEHFVYDAKRVNRLRQFATGNTLQILIINIDAFRKNFTGTEAEQKSNVIYKESDKLSGRQPIEFVQAARPIVIIDEPQSVDSTDKSQEAIKALNPLCTLRYSATHKNPYNLIYRLDPVRAFELRLVKQIVVASAVAYGGANDAFIRVESIVHQPSIKAKVRIHVQGADGPKEKSVTIKNGDDLFVRSNERASYAQGYSVAEINAEPDAEFIRFTNGLTLRIGQEVGGMRDDIWRVQIRHTVKKHLDKELQLHNRGIKVLSLFFVDRVASYRDYDAAGKPIKGKFARWFEEELAALAKEPRYSVLQWTQLPLDKLHNGYFAQDRKGVFKDTKGDTQADDDVYNLIMKDKEQLLSNDEPLRFIFSHSALREGWDNPNVFQICTLNETKSAMKKRQEIGRGLRLPVDQEGKRVFDETINKLYVRRTSHTRTSPAPCKPNTRRIAASPSARCQSQLSRVLRAQWTDKRYPSAKAPPRQSERRSSDRKCLRQMAASGWRSICERRTSSWSCRRNIPICSRRSLTCWRPTKSSGTSAKRPTKSQTASGKKLPSAPTSKPCGIASSQGRPTASNLKPTLWLGVL